MRAPGVVGIALKCKTELLVDKPGKSPNGKKRFWICDGFQSVIRVDVVL